MEVIEQKFNELTTDIKTFIGKAGEDIKNIGSVATETKSALDAMKREMHERLNAQQTQLDAIDAKSQQRHVTNGEQKSLGEQLVNDGAFLEAKGRDFSGRKPINMQFKGGLSSLERKTAVTETGLGTGTSGVLMPVRLPGVVGIPQQALRIRDVMNVVPQTTGNAFDYVYQSTRTNAASPQVEGSAKAESTLNWQSAIGYIRTIAHWTSVSKQSLSDIPWLRGTMDGEMIYGLKVKEEAEILSGDGTGQHLNGLITQATAFDTNLLIVAAGWTRLDILRLAKLQARLAGLASYAPSAFVLHPTDLARVELTKDESGHYVVGDPRTGVEVDYIWKLPVVESDSIAAGTFLTGAFMTAAELRDREQVTTDISFEHGNNFTENMATLLCEERIGLAVKKATAFISGSFTTSPASQN